MEEIEFGDEVFHPGGHPQISQISQILGRRTDMMQVLLGFVRTHHPLMCLAARDQTLVTSVILSAVCG